MKLVLDKKNHLYKKLGKTNTKTLIDVLHFLATLFM